jgi:hypothetical protein
MFKPIKYRIVFWSNGAIAIKQATRVLLGPLSAYRAYFEEKPPEGMEVKPMELPIEIDWLESFLQEFTGKFDAEGAEVYSGDILEAPVRASDGSTDRRLYVIQFVEGSFLATNELHEEAIPLTEAFCITAKRVGTIYTNSDLIDRPIDETIFTPKTE